MTNDREYGAYSNPKSNTIYSWEYFRNLAKEISQKEGFISDKDLLKHSADDFVYIGTGDSQLNIKADLKNKGKKLEKDDKFEAIKFYDELKTNELFKNDYYPYRRQCILFKNRIKEVFKRSLKREQIITNSYAGNSKYGLGQVVFCNSQCLFICKLN